MAAFAATRAIFPRLLIACWLVAAGVSMPDVAVAQTPPTDLSKPTPEQPAPPTEAAKPEPQRTTETPAVVIDGSAAQSLLGKSVQSLKGEDLGRIVDVIVDRAGILRAAIVDFGGFLGVGTRKIAVDWRLLHFPENGPMNKLSADLQRDQLRNAPVYKEGEPVVVIGGASASPAPAAPALPSPPPPPVSAEKP
ncbi:PRC-barrel domain-containing protein [Rhodoblastus sp.]|uniref:PRC-barrel domain-containing protein n=1 Tax=Rhodoblastus sp. TaxID=1962975 RepID=UPI003F9AE9BE